MKSIEIDDDLYAFIASQTKHIGESASQILRRLLLPEDGEVSNGDTLVNKQDSQTNRASVATVRKPVAAAPKTRAPSENVSASKKAKTTAKPATKKVSTTKSVGANKNIAAKAQLEPAVEQHDKRDILDALSKDALNTFTKRVDQFLFVLSAAYKLNAEQFSNVERIKGKNRTYFATSKEALLENGSSTNPKLIPESPFWVVTNNNTAKKVSMLEQVLRNLGYKPDVIDDAVARFSS